MKPQTTPIKSAEEMFREATEKHISENPNEDFFSIDEIMQSDETKVVLSVIHNFASIQTTAKEKEFCERLEKEIAKIELTISGYKNSAHDLFAAGYCTALEAQKVLLNKLIQNYKK